VRSISATSASSRSGETTRKPTSASTIEKLIFQSDWSAINPQGCDQQFVMSVDGSELSDSEQYRLVSTGSGRTTCGYFLPDGRMIYASTHADSPECPAPRPSPAGVYAWPIYESFDIYITDENGENPQPLVAGPYYDAEATVSPDGRYMVFTSTRGGDLDLWLYEFETEEMRQITDGRGYDGGAFFSPDSRMIVWRASRPEGEALERYQRLLTEGLVEPGALDIRVMNVDGTGERVITDLPGANWAPFFHPSGERVLFSSNHHTLSGGRPGLRHLHGQPRRHRTDTDHAFRHVRFLPDVLVRRIEAGLLVEPQRRTPPDARYERVRGRLDR
jgi:TolB protein